MSDKKREKVYAYKLATADFILKNKAVISKLLFGTSRTEGHPLHHIEFNSRGLISYTKSTENSYPPVDNSAGIPGITGDLINPIMFPGAVLDSAKAEKIARAYIDRVNIAVDSVSALTAGGIRQFFPSALPPVVTLKDKIWHVSYTPKLKGSNLKREKEIPVQYASFTIKVSSLGIVGLEYNFRPIISYVEKPALSEIELKMQNSSTFSTWTIPEMSTMIFKFEADNDDPFLIPHFPSLLGPMPAFQRSVVLVNGITGTFKKYDRSNHHGRLLKDEWLPDVEMKRIITHWSASGSYNTAPGDVCKYHFHIEGNGNIIRGASIAANSKGATVADNSDCKKIAYHTLRTNTYSIGVTMEGNGAGSPSQSGLSFGTNPIKQIQWETMARVVAELSDFYKIPVSRVTIMAHGRVQENLKECQRGKWDPCVLPWEVKAKWEEYFPDEDEPWVSKRAELNAGKHKDLKEDLKYLFKSGESFHRVGDKFRNLVRSYKQDMGYPIFEDGFMIEIGILNRTLVAVQTKKGLFARLDDLKFAFHQYHAYTYCKSGKPVREVAAQPNLPEQWTIKRKFIMLKKSLLTELKLPI